MTDRVLVEKLVRSRAALRELPHPDPARTRAEAEGGCGVIGIASSVPVAGRHLLRSLVQMRNRGNGKGGGAALVGLSPNEFGVSAEILRRDTLLAVAYLDPGARGEVEADFIHPGFEVDHVHVFDPRPVEGLEARPPVAACYFVRPKDSAVEDLAQEHKLEAASRDALDDEFVYQNSYRLNAAYYASLGEKRAFVLSHGKDLLALKMVGYGDDVVRAYGLEGMHAHVWIGHHRYPTKGRVWHPGGAHPFVGLNEALVHNGDFANYASVCTYLAQRNIFPLFLTDTEVSVLVFDLLHRTYGYPLEYVIEALAPTTERDFAMLPAAKQEIYRKLQMTHLHGSPDGPWFFLIAQSRPNGSSPRTASLIGITDTSMLRPQVFALQQGGPGEASIGFAASEKQAIDAALADLAAEDARFWTRPDLIWNARGGSHTDGGAFIFNVERAEDGSSELVCADKFGRRIELSRPRAPYYASAQRRANTSINPEGRPEMLFGRVREHLETWSYADLEAFLGMLAGGARTDSGRALALETLNLLIDRRYDPGALRRSSILSLCDQALNRVFESIQGSPSAGFAYHQRGDALVGNDALGRAVVLDGRGFEAQGADSLAGEIVRLAHSGYSRILAVNVHGQRFLGNGLGPESDGVHIEVYGSPGDYLGSGMDGAGITVHANGQDQLAQILKRGRLVVHGDVGQTFMYAAKGGEAFVLGNAAGRPLINAVGKPRVVINGTCLDYLAESFMAGDALNGGGFVILNGIAFGERGELLDLPTPYPGGNLFSLASGGAIFLRDPHRKVGEDQLNGGRFEAFEAAHWGLVRPMLEENERLFGIAVEELLTVQGEQRAPGQIYRAILPAGSKVLMPEEAWVAH